MYQKCPVCEGSGKKHDYGNMGSVPCSVCNGEGIINASTGRPPYRASYSDCIFTVGLDAVNNTVTGALKLMQEIKKHRQSKEIIPPNN